MNFIKFIFLLLLCSCLKPADLDKLQEYANTELEKDVKEFASLEIKKWWDDYFKAQAMLVIANAKAFESTLSIVQRPVNNDKKSSNALLDELIKLYELNLSLKTLSFQSQNIANYWEQSCEDKQVSSQIGLKDKIYRNYMSGLRFPTLAETYMIGGGTGEDGASKMIEAITTNLGSLFNRDKAKAIKKKVDVIKRTFDAKMPSNEALALISKDVCIKASRDQASYLDSIKPLISMMSESSQREWNFYNAQKEIIGKILLIRNILELQKGNKELDDKLGIAAKNSLLANLAQMRSYLLSISDTFKGAPTLSNKELFEDFIISFEVQLKLLQTINFSEAKKIAAENNDFVQTVRRSIK